MLDIIFGGAIIVISQEFLQITMASKFPSTLITTIKHYATQAQTPVSLKQMVEFGKALLHSIATYVVLDLIRRHQNGSRRLADQICA